MQNSQVFPMSDLESIFQVKSSQHRQEIMSSILVPKILKTSSEAGGGGGVREREAERDREWNLLNLL